MPTPPRLIEARHPRGLPEPYRAWADPDLPLPEGTVHVPPDADIVLIGAGATVIGGIFAMGGASILNFIVADALRKGVEVLDWLCGVPTALGLFLGGVWGYRIWLRNLRWRRAKRAGRLREGLLIGPDAALVWMPSGCALIPRHACLAVRCDLRRESKHTVRTLVIELRDPDATPDAPAQAVAYDLDDFDTDDLDEDLDALLRRWAGCGATAGA